MSKNLIFVYSSYENRAIACHSVALLRMVASGAAFRGDTLFWARKKVFAVKLLDFRCKLGWRPHKKKKQGFHHKSVELWFHIIIWCPPNGVTPKWCHPGRAALPPSYATVAIYYLWIIFFASMCVKKLCLTNQKPYRTSLISTYQNN